MPNPNTVPMFLMTVKGLQNPDAKWLGVGNLKRA